MLRTTRPLLSASARGLPRSGAPIALASISLTRRSASSTPWRTRAPATVAAPRLLTTPFFVQRANYAVKNERDKAFEKKVSQEKLESDPEHVTSQSSVRQFEPPTRPASGTDSAGLKEDLVWLIALLLNSAGMNIGMLTTKQFRATSKKPSRSTASRLYHTNWDWPAPYHTSRHLLLLATALGT